MNNYVQRILDSLIDNNPNEKEFIQAATEILESLSLVFDRHPEYEKAGILELLVEPERIISFRVPWVDDEGIVRVNKGYRVQYNSALGPYKGGLRFHPTVNLSIMKFLAFEQIFKNSLTGLSIGGGKGGSNFDPKGKSDREVMAFCQSFISELYRHIGASTDVPAGDIGVGSREIGYMFGYYKKLANEYKGVLTGRGISYGGSLVRVEATGYGLVYFLDEMMRCNYNTVANKKVVISGSGNVAIYAHEKITQMGAKVIAMSDSGGYIYDENGINLDIIKYLKEANRERISKYVEKVPCATYVEGCNNIWQIPCDIALPCATQNEIDINAAETLVKNGVCAVAEGANMPCTLEAANFFLNNNVLYGPSKAANAGGVATSALEMAQSSQRLFWSFDEVDGKLRSIMIKIFHDIDRAANEYGVPKNYIVGANISGFNKICSAMLAQGVC